MKDKKARKPSLSLFLGIQKEMKDFKSQGNNKKSSIEHQKKKNERKKQELHILLKKFHQRSMDKEIQKKETLENQFFSK